MRNGNKSTHFEEIDQIILAVQKTIIHIGYHKTASSFIQQKIFMQHPDLFYSVNRAAIRSHFVLPSPLHYDGNKTKDFCKGELDKKPGVRYHVFSDEYLSAGIHMGDHHSKYVADRLKECLPDSKIIIGIREQKSMIKSAYSQYLRARGSFGLKDYIIRPKTKQFAFEHLNYDKLIDYYMKLFGTGQVLVLPYEQLRNEPDVYLSRLMEFLDWGDKAKLADLGLKQRVNKSLKISELKVKRYFNPFIMRTFPDAGRTFNLVLFKYGYKIFRRIWSMLPTRRLDQRLSRRIDREIEKLIEGRYHNSNRITSELTGVDLKEFGYPI